MGIADQVLGIILLLLGSACFEEGIRVWDGMWETGFLPVIMGIVFGALALGFLFSRSSRREIFQISWPVKANRQKVVFVYLSLILYTLLIPWMGYLLGTTLFLIGLVRTLGGVRWGYGLFFSLATSSCTYLIFKVWLNMPLPGGVLGV